MCNVYESILNFCETVSLLFWHSHFLQVLASTPRGGGNRYHMPFMFLHLPTLYPYNWVGKFTCTYYEPVATSWPLAFSIGGQHDHAIRCAPDRLIVSLSTTSGRIHPVCHSCLRRLSRAASHSLPLPLQSSFSSDGS